MKIWIVSDLHTNSLHWIPEHVPPHDVMIIAGDLADSVIESILKLHEIARWHKRPIIFVPGNHDVFGSSLHAWGSEKPRLLGVDVYVLSCGQTVVIDGVRFVGATLWTDFLLNDREYQAQSWAAKNMPDYQHIRRHDGELIWPKDVAEEHDRHLAAIEAALARPFAGSTVVVTHHAPSAKSLQPGDRLHESAGAFASDLEPLIWSTQPTLWVHGHSHRTADYRIGGTRVVTNPRGYQSATWAEQTGWEECKVVEV